MSVSALVAVVVALWRGCSELVERRRELSARGELAERIERRRREVVRRALALTEGWGSPVGQLADGRAHARERALVRVGPAGAGAPVALGSRVGDGRPPAFVPTMPRLGAHAAVAMGVRAEAAADVDDVGLLEASMRRAASERMDVAATGVRRAVVARARQAAASGELHIAAELLAATPAHGSAKAGPRPSRPLASARRREPVRSSNPSRRERAARLAAAAGVAASPGPGSSGVREPAPSIGPAIAEQPSPSAPGGASASAQSPRPQRRDGGWTDWRWLAGEPEVLLDIDERSTARTWPLPTVLVGTLLTLLPLVRPLADGAPWLALAGISLVIAGWAGARRD